MNGFKRVYCRIYQAAFHAALPFLPYREPKLYRETTEVVTALEELNIQRVLLVTDSVLRTSGITLPLENLLRDRGIHCAVYDATRANPTVDNVEEARQLYLSEDCRGLIAFGGGSSMDCAKAVGARIAYPKKPLGKLKGTLRVLRKIPPLIAIPTTAGTGSEVTVTAVITDEKQKHKYTINAFPLIPAYAVLDPKVTYTLPPHLTATTGMDALTHAVEAYIGRSTTKETRAQALEAVSLIFGNIETAYRDGQNHEARERMLRAAYLAGIAFSKSYVGYIHAVAHSLGGQYHIPHGLANSVLMPYVLEAYGASAEKKLQELGVAAGVCDGTETRSEGAKTFIESIRELNRRMQIPDHLEGIRREDVPLMARHADREANPLYPVPKLMNAKQLEVFYEQVATGRGRNETH